MSYFSATTFRTLGTAATTQNLLGIANGSSSTKIVRLVDVSVYMDANVALTAVMPQFKLNRCVANTTNLIGGTSLTKAIWSSANTASDANITVLGTTASDGGAATTITATFTATQCIAQVFNTRAHTLVDAMHNQIPYKLVSQRLTSNGYNLRLRPGEGALLNLVATATTSNPATNMYVANVTWEET